MLVSPKKKVLGPPRQSERRAENDLATLREAARAQKTWPEQVAAMQQAAQVLRESAQLENRVARGIAQYEAHNTDNSIIQYTKIHYTALHYTTLQYNTIQYNTIQ